jgi:hypothetical protein
MDGFGLMYYNARWYDPMLGRFAQADTIVAGENHNSAPTMQHVAGTMYTPLTVGYYEQPVLAKLNSDNSFVQRNGGSLLGLSDAKKRQASIVGVPLSAQVFDRYAYSQNNPISFTDPSGHTATVVDERELTLAELRAFQVEMNNLRGKIFYGGLGVAALIECGAVLSSPIPPAAGALALVGIGVGAASAIEAQQVEDFADYLDEVIDLAEENNYSESDVITLQLSEIEGEGLDSLCVMVTTDLAPGNHNYLAAVGTARALESWFAGGGFQPLAAYSFGRY